MKIGTKLFFGNNELTATVKDVTDNGNRIIEFGRKQGDGSSAFWHGGDKKHKNRPPAFFAFQKAEEPSPCFSCLLEKLGEMPLPPYIHEKLEDAERYQTVYSKEAGSAAAPTAGLHFTQNLLDELESKGIKICYLTLHVGLGTFRPVKTEKIEEHEMHAEYFTINKETANTINRVKESGGRVMAVGTTSCRVLESCTDEAGIISASSGFTDIFIYPGYKFKCINGLITNFHLPESTLIMLVSAFASREKTLKAYDEAIKQKYRFFSFGDAMIIL